MTSGRTIYCNTLEQFVGGFMELESLLEAWRDKKPSSRDFSIINKIGENGFKTEITYSDEDTSRDTGNIA